MGMDPKTAAGLSYLTWIAGLVFFLSEKQNRFVRFHAMQEILYTVAYTVIIFVLYMFSFIVTLATAQNGSPMGGALSGCLIGIAFIAFFVGWLIAIINAFQGKMFKLPLVGDWAQKIAYK